MGATAKILSCKSEGVVFEEEDEEWRFTKDNNQSRGYFVGVGGGVSLSKSEEGAAAAAVMVDEGWMMEKAAKEILT
jgi:hypothetical protein